MNIRHKHMNFDPTTVTHSIGLWLHKHNWSYGRVIWIGNWQGMKSYTNGDVRLEQGEWEDILDVLDGKV